MPNITTVSVEFGNGIKREEYGPTKTAKVSITAAVDDKEDGELVLAEISDMAIRKVAQMLDAPKPVAAVANDSQEAAPAGNAPPARRGRKPKPEPTSEEATPSPAASEEAAPADAAPAEPAAEEDELAAGETAIEITDQELLGATSKRAGELGARDPILKLIGTFATRTDGPPFKVQEIPQAQRRDYLEKLKALTA